MSGKPLAAPPEAPRTKQPIVLARMDQRAALNRAYAAAEMRQKLKGGVILNQLRHIDAELRLINAQLRKGEGEVVDGADAGKVTREALTEGEQRTLALRLQVLKQRADLNFRKLNKILPDLRAMELSDPNGDNPLAPLLNAIAAAARDGQGSNGS